MCITLPQVIMERCVFRRTNIGRNADSRYTHRALRWRSSWTGKVPCIQVITRPHQLRRHLFSDFHQPTSQRWIERCLSHCSAWLARPFVQPASWKANSLSSLQCTVYCQKLHEVKVRNATTLSLWLRLRSNYPAHGALSTTGLCLFVHLFLA